MSSARLVLFGPPGAGKGTQALFLKERLSLPHLGSGDLFRHHLREKTALGVRAAEFMNQGLLVPDEVTIDIMLNEVLGLPQAEGFILDGFPRTQIQAVALDQALKQGSRNLDQVLLIDVPKEELVRRLGGRYICRDCQAPHTLAELDRPGESRCSRCGGELYQRPDDSDKNVRKRIEVYRTETVPVLEFYREQGLLADISGLGSVESVSQRVLEVMGPELAPKLKPK